MDKKKQKIILMLISLSLLFSAVSVASAQTDSLRVWENIADGSLVSTWVENETADWTPQNDSGVWEYNCSVTADVSFTFNETYSADRWFDTFEVTSDDSEAGVGSVMVNNLTSYYAIVYYYAATDHGPEDGSPCAHLVCYDEDHFDYWNGTGFESNSSNASDLDNDWEKDYTGGFFRVKVMWDFHSTIGCSLHFKLWDPSGDEYPLWMVDLEFPNHPSITTTTFKSGLFVDSRYDLDASETDFRRIFFWDTSYDLYAPILPVVNNHIVCPTINAYDAFDLYMDAIDTDDIYNTTQLFKTYINLWDLDVIYTEDFYGATGNQNDSTYVFSLMMTDTRDFYTDMFGPGIPDDFPDNIFIMEIYNTPDASSNESDYMLLRIDTDNNDVYDSYDYAIWSNDTDLITYQGWTPFTTTFFADMYGGPVWADEFGEVFRDDTYFMWYVTINWDMIYNGSSGERIGDDLCRMSIDWYDADTDVMLLLQDYDPTDDANPYPATDGRNASRDPTWQQFNDSSNWLYFQVDESISGEPMADPEDPVVTPDVQFSDLGAVGLLAKIIIDLVLIFIALALVYFIAKDFMAKKHKTMKDTIEVFKLIVIVLVFMGIVAGLVAVL
jgi:hypothetical protein